MSQTSEEKSLPASDKKLRDARRKGQVSKSQDLVSGVVILASTIFLAMVGGDVQDKVAALIDLVSRIYEDPFAEVWPRVVAIGLKILVDLSVPMLLVSVAAIILTNIGAMRGLVFTVEPITPNPEHISPIAGFKRIFSMRGVVEFFKALFKIVALGAAFVLVFRVGLQALMQSSACGPSCISGSFFSILQPLVITAVVGFLIVGIVDVLLQNWLFGRDMKMTKTERKRETRDADGDPMVRQQRQRQRREMQALATKTGLMQASLLIGTPEGWTVGIRYVRGETPVPMLVCRAMPDQARTMITEALLAGIPVVRDDGLATAISRAARTGEPVPEACFQPVADLLVAARLI